MAWLKTMITIFLNQQSQNITKDSRLAVDSESCRSAESGTETWNYCIGQSNTCPVPDIDQHLTMLYTPPHNCEQKREQTIASHDQFKGTCTTPECIYAASKILHAMNRNADPCNDFYEFACGSYERTTKIPIDRKKVNRWDTARDETFKKIKYLIGTKVKANDPKVLAYPKILFQSCMNVNDYAGSENTLMSILNEIGGWPVLKNNWSKKNYTWDQYIYHYNKNGFLPNYLMEFGLNSASNQLAYVELGPATLGIGHKFLIEAESDINNSQYFLFMVRIAIAFGASESKAKNDLREVVKFEIALAKAKKLRGIPGFHTVSSLEHMYPSIPWLEYINNIIVPHYRYYETSEVLIKNPSYFQSLQELLAKSSTRLIANYLAWRAVRDSLVFLPDKFKSIQNQFYDSIGYRSILRQTREDFCAYAISDRMPIAVRSLFVNSDLGVLKADKIQILELAQDLKNMFYSRASTYNWLSQSSQKTMQKTLTELIIHVSYPIDILLKPKEFEDYYKQVDIRANKTFIQLMLDLSKFNFKYKLTKKPWEEKAYIGCDLFDIFADNPKLKWILCANSIEISAPAVHAFYSNLLPGFVNYGNIAANIAFEMLRSIQKPPWWQTDDISAFKARTSCFLRKYNVSTKHFNLKINPYKTLDTNVLDLGAALIAFQAYERWIYSKGGDKKLIGLENFSPKQLFWLSYANSRCSKYSKNELHQVILKKKYMPPRERVNLPLAQLWEFAKDFECPKGSKMYSDISDSCSTLW